MFSVSCWWGAVAGPEREPKWAKGGPSVLSRAKGLLSEAERVTVPQDDHPVKISIEQSAPKKQSPKWLEPALYGALGLATAADVGTTIKGLHKGYREANPLMKPFAKLGPAGVILAGGGLGALSAWGAHELKKRKIPAWWLGPALGTVAHSLAARSNARLIKRGR